ncbi:hypothetical protein CAEBREN_04168 [Caenorhabditis brenneri]|uniref:Uncharacterized protein n=1 Tax=Caenorhabditis brenneri TaxID=135651 RepID=G0MUZ5_CAEBE|nr:hypothetical protein CAEBREN_04168 [Caenorhabditis brenneri]
MEKHKDNFDIWFRALHPKNNENSHFRVFENSRFVGATGPLASIESSLEILTRVVHKPVFDRYVVHLGPLLNY